MTDEERLTKQCKHAALYAAVAGCLFLAILLAASALSYRAGQESILPQCPPSGYRVMVPAGKSFVKEMKRGGKVRVTIEFEDAEDAYEVAKCRNEAFYIIVKREKR